MGGAEDSDENEVDKEFQETPEMQQEANGGS